uniref:Uncharacterized protein n=1 Tax=Oryza brachyantha TaxID=4533 RepID=J3NBW9_ORYBR
MGRPCQEPNTKTAHIDPFKMGRIIRPISRRILLLLERGRRRHWRPPPVCSPRARRAPKRNPTASWAFDPSGGGGGNRRRRRWRSQARSRARRRRATSRPASPRTCSIPGSV